MQASLPKEHDHRKRPTKPSHSQAQEPQPEHHSSVIARKGLERQERWGGSVNPPHQLLTFSAEFSLPPSVLPGWQTGGRADLDLLQAFSSVLGQSYWLQPRLGY